MNKHLITYKFFYLNNIFKPNFLVSFRLKSELPGITHSAIKGWARLFSTTIAKTSPTENQQKALDKRNTTRWSKLVANVPGLSEQVQKRKERSENEDYRIYDDYLSDKDVTEETKVKEVLDTISTLKAKYHTNMVKHKMDTTSPNNDAVTHTKNEYNNNRDALMKAAKDNNVPIDKIDFTLNIDKATDSAIKLVNKELRVEHSLPKIKDVSKEERDEFLSLQQQSEPMDILDPDA